MTLGLALSAACLTHCSKDDIQTAAVYKPFAFYPLEGIQAVKNDARRRGMRAGTVPCIYRHYASNADLEVVFFQDDNVCDHMPSNAISKFATAKEMGDCGFSMDGCADWGEIDALIRKEIRDTSSRAMIVIPGDSRNQRANRAFGRH